MTIKCAGCKNYHGSVAEVRACQTGGGVATATRTPRVDRFKAIVATAKTDQDWKVEYAAREAAQERAAYAAKMARDDAPTEKQISFLLSLQNSHASQIRHAFSEAAIRQMDRLEVSNHISRLKGLPVAAPAAPVAAPVADVPAGRYALNSADGVKFYVVDRPETGAWAGRTFLSALASDEKHPIKNPAHRATVLAAILAMGLQESTVLFGRELGQCGRCGRTLTDETSRAAGIGPICSAKGW